MAHICLRAGLATCLVLALLTVGSVHAQNENHQAATIATTLEESSATKLAIPRFGFSDEPQCDDHGDVFFHLYSGSYRISTIFELTADADKSLLYRLPVDLAREVGFESFAVSPSGELYVLGQIREGTQDSDVHEYVFSFSDSDGSMTSKLRLQTPHYILADAFTVLQGGVVLFSGHFVKEAPEELRGKRYAALFDASGRVSKVLDTQGKVDERLLAGGAATRGRDGYAYLLGNSEVTVFSPAGEIARRIPFQNPDPNAIPTSIKLSEGLMSITLSKVGKDHWIEPRYLVVDAFTGSIYAYYVPSKDLGNQTLCFSRNTGYTFLKLTDDGNYEEILRAPLR